MVFKSIQNIKQALPDVIEVVMFYNNGIIFQTTFEQSINIPKLGEHLSELIDHFKKIHEICNLHAEEYQKIIFESENVSMVIFKLGEDSNIALFFKRKDVERIKFSAIKKYLERIEELIDMDKKELEKTEP